MRKLLKGRGVRGEGGAGSQPIRGPADDGKRSEAVDVVVGLLLGENFMELGRGSGGGGLQNRTGAKAGGFLF